MSDDLALHGVKMTRLTFDPNSASGFRVEEIPMSTVYLDPRDARIAQLEYYLAQARAERDAAHNAAIDDAANVIRQNIVGYGANEPYLRPRPDGDVSNLLYAVTIEALKRP